MTENARAVGILGGTYDPVHIGHLRLAIEACEALALEHVRLVPLNSPAHRPPPATPPATRLAMLAAATSWPLVVDDCELVRGGVSYTVDTLQALRARWPQRPLCLLLGRDAYHGLPSWHRPERVLELAHIVVAARPGEAGGALAGLDELVGNAQSLSVQDLQRKPAGHVYFLDIPLLPIASSDVRARRAAGRDIRHLVPTAVHDIILERGLYT